MTDAANMVTTASDQLVPTPNADDLPRRFSNFATFGEALDDSSAATEIKTRLFGAGGFSRFGEVDVAVVDRFVLLSGRVPSDADRKEAERIAWQVGSVDEVANELQIENWDLGRDMNDAWITEQVRDRKSVV